MGATGAGRRDDLRTAERPALVDGQWDAEALAALIPALRDEYRSAEPWPHVVVRGLFPADLLRQAAAEISASDRDRMEATTSRTMRKRESADMGLAGPATESILRLLDAPEMLTLISEITGVADLQADPCHFWAGVHETPDGGFTMVHTDFLEHPESGLHHRANCLLYLNEGWQASWGGCLELWPRSMDRLGRSILPELNTLVLFETTASTMHGLPDPVHAPDGRSRLSLAAYQYSTNPSHDTRQAGIAKYRRRPGDRFRVGVPSRWDLKERVPEPVRRRIAATRRRIRTLR